MADEQDIKEILEAINGIKLLALAEKSVMKDGKVDLSDLTVLKDLFENKQAILDAVNGISAIPAEAKDLSVGEIMQLVTALFDAFKEIKDA